ncbi:MAG: hypothetical protein PHC51_12295 [bacterium]|nr:hypothetical protein [bacterium]
MQVGGVSLGSGGAQAANAVTVKVSEKQEDSQEKVVKKLIDSIDVPQKASRAGHETGQKLDVTA